MADDDVTIVEEPDPNDQIFDEPEPEPVPEDITIIDDKS